MPERQGSEIRRRSAPDCDIALSCTKSPSKRHPSQLADIILHHLCVAVFKVRSSCFFVPRLDVEDVSPAVAPPLPFLPPSNVESSARSMRSMLRMPVAKFNVANACGKVRRKISLGEAEGRGQNFNGGSGGTANNDLCECRLRTSKWCRITSDNNTVDERA